MTWSAFRPRIGDPGARVLLVRLKNLSQAGQIPNRVADSWSGHNVYFDIMSPLQNSSIVQPFALQVPKLQDGLPAAGISL